jgi:HD-like signal output (HDOD) protein
MVRGATSARHRRIGEILIEEGLVKSDQLLEALRSQKKSGNRIVQELVNLGHLDINELATFLSRQPGVPSIELANYAIPENVCKLIPKDFALRHEIFPIDHLGNLLTVGMAFPLDRDTIDELEHITGLSVKALLCRASDIRAAVKRYYPDDDSETADATAEHVAADLKLGGIVDLIHKIDDLPTLPDTVAEVQRVTDASGSSMKHVADVVSRDPAITAKLLQLANAPAYGFTSRVSTIERATTLLGLKETFMVVLSAAVVDLTQKSNHFDYEQYWAESMSCALACRMVAQAKNQRPDGALRTAGLLCGIGRFALSETVPARYAKVDPSLRGLELLEAEEAAFGIGHPEAGFELVSHWALPEEIAMAVRYHLHPERADQHHEIVGTVALANYIARLCLTRSEPAAEAYLGHEKALDMAGITVSQAVQIQKDVAQTS